MRVCIGAALLLAFIAGSDCTLWFPKIFSCSKAPKEPRICGNDGVTYSSLCAFKKVQVLLTWLKILHRGPCETPLIADVGPSYPQPDKAYENQSNRRPIKRTTPYPIYSYEDDYPAPTKPRRRRTTTPRKPNDDSDYYSEEVIDEPPKPAKPSKPPKHGKPHANLDMNNAAENVNDVQASDEYSEINVGLNNNANNDNNIKIKKGQTKIDMKLDNKAGNKNKIQFGRYLFI